MGRQNPNPTKTTTAGSSPSAPPHLAQALNSPPLLRRVKRRNVLITEYCVSGLRPEVNTLLNLQTPAHPTDALHARDGGSAAGLRTPSCHQPPEAEDPLRSGPGPGAPRAGPHRPQSRPNPEEAPPRGPGGLARPRRRGGARTHKGSVGAEQNPCPGLPAQAQARVALRDSQSDAGRVPRPPLPQFPRLLQT